MDVKVFKYRRYHPCCGYCKYLRFNVPLVNGEANYFDCEAKEKIIKPLYMPRWLCSCYEVKKEE